jgi:hypothetical protein
LPTVKVDGPAMEGMLSSQRAEIDELKQHAEELKQEMATQKQQMARLLQLVQQQQPQPAAVAAAAAVAVDAADINDDDVGGSTHVAMRGVHGIVNVPVLRPIDYRSIRMRFGQGDAATRATAKSAHIEQWATRIAAVLTTAHVSHKVTETSIMALGVPRPIAKLAKQKLVIAALNN